jgi:hypothetical protein
MLNNSFSSLGCLRALLANLSSSSCISFIVTKPFT